MLGLGCPRDALLSHGMGHNPFALGSLDPPPPHTSWQFIESPCKCHIIRRKKRLSGEERIGPRGNKLYLFKVESSGWGGAVESRIACVCDCEVRKEMSLAQRQGDGPESSGHLGLL